MKLSCFGKLPFYPDFIRINGSDFSSVDQWFQKGIMQSMQKWGREWQERFRTSPRYKFVFQTPKSGKALTGAFIPGEDRGGRTFPFSIYTETPKIPLKELNTAIELAEQGFLNRVEEFFDNGWAGADLKGFQEHFRSWESTVNSSPPPLFYKNQPMAHFWKESFGGFEESKKFLVVKNLVDILAPFKKGVTPKSFPGFRIPFNNDAESSSGVALFWVGMIKALTGPDSLSLSILWQSSWDGKDQPYIYFFTGEPTPKSFIQMVDPECTGETFPTDLSTVRADRLDELKEKLDPQIKSLMDSPDINVSTFLARING